MSTLCSIPTPSQPGPEPQAVIDPATHPLRGRGLRFVLIDELMTRGELSVAQMAATLAAHGYDLGGRASKIISDALRWEVRRGRVLRPARGRYRFHQAPVSTVRRIQIFATRARNWIAAVTSHRTPPTTPANPRGSTIVDHDPRRPPWNNHWGWLWAS
jgi:hypothetical protein